MKKITEYKARQLFSQHLDKVAPKIIINAVEYDYSYVFFQLDSKEYDRQFYVWAKNECYELKDLE